MKRILTVMILLLFLNGCVSTDGGMERALAMRENFQNNTCTFQAKITADYGEYLHTFTLDCSMNELGNVTFTVEEPESIEGISGRMADDGGTLIFDDKVLAFEFLVDEQLSPISAPWVVLRGIRSGYIHACSKTDDGLKVILDDSYADESLQIDLWLDEENTPVDAEILWQGRRILSIRFENFYYQ